MDDLLITFNTGSSSVKIGLFEFDAGKARRIAKGVIDFRTSPLSFRLSEGSDVLDVDLVAAPSQDLTPVLGETFGLLAERFDMDRIAAVGHRIVHGGERFSGPVRIDAKTIEAIESLAIFAPLHQPQSLRLINAIGQLHPSLPQSASFDTAFHRTQPETVRRFALPRALHDEGIQRYGFHGLSYKSIVETLKREAPDVVRGKIVAAHLGSGASLCALDGGISRDVSMGFSTLDGIPMATRCGTLDPGVVLHLLKERKMPLEELETLLYFQSGLLGVSGISADSRELLASDAAEAREALELFALRIAGEVGRLSATLGGLDALVFTAGIGENQPGIRTDICARLTWLGLDIDPEANAGNAMRISRPTSRISAFVIPTDEEQIIADETVAVLNGRHP